MKEPQVSKSGRSPSCSYISYEDPSERFEGRKSADSDLADDDLFPRRLAIDLDRSDRLQHVLTRGHPREHRVLPVQRPALADADEVRRRSAAWVVAARNRDDARQIRRLGELR